jgi:hypothetical protein
VPHALNPLDGVFIHYALAAKPDGELTIDVLDSAGVRIRHMLSIAGAPVKEAAQPPHPNFWLAPPDALPAEVGMNRAAWDLRYDAPPAFTHSFEINANPGLTPASPEGGIAPPGVYTIKLTVNGKTYTQKATVLRDPNSPATTADLRAQHTLLRKIQDGIATAWNGYQQAVAVRASLTAAMPADTQSVAAKKIVAFRARLDSIAGNAEGGRGFGGRGGGRTPPPTFVAVHGRLVTQLTDKDNGDLAPTEPMLHAFASSCHDLASAVGRWQSLSSSDLPALNVELQKIGKTAVTLPAITPPKC